MLDYTLALDTLEDFHADFPSSPTRGARSRSFRIANGAFLAAYRFALDFIDLAEHDPKLGVMLNDAVDDLGLPAGSYDGFKFRFLNVAAATRFTAYRLAAAFGNRDGGGAAAEEDADRILEPAGAAARRSPPGMPSTYFAGSAHGQSFPSRAGSRSGWATRGCSGMGARYKLRADRPPARPDAPRRHHAATAGMVSLQCRPSGILEPRRSVRRHPG